MNDHTLKNNTKKDVMQEKFEPKQKKVIKLTKSFFRLKLFKRAERMSNCGKWLKFGVCVNDHKTLKKADFCHDRLCPMCNWRRSLLLYREIIQLLHVAVERRKMRFIFLTLTVKNVPGDDLYGAITVMFNSFRQLFKYREVDKNIIGWIRNLEITYNGNDDTYHPHFHILIGVIPAYFDGANYISQARWTSFWQKAARLDYVPVVNIKAVKPNREDQTIESAVDETAKYSVKDSEYIRNSNKQTDEIVGVLVTAIKGRRMIGFGKQFRQIRKELDQQDIESNSADLVGNSHRENCLICNSTLQEQLYKWDFNTSKYVRQFTTKGGK